MSFGSILYQLLLSPLTLILEAVYAAAYHFLRSYGAAIIPLSIAVNLLLLPFYNRADAIQEQEKDRQKRMEPFVDHIKKTFKGDERYMMLQAFYKENNYKPVYALKSSIALLLQIPFFIAAYNFLSDLPVLQGASFWVIKDLGQPDKLLTIGGLTINVLPVLMTLINVVSSEIYTKGLKFKDKIQLHGMAMIFLVLLYNSPSGLVLYWTLNNIFSLGKNIVYLRKKSRKAASEKQSTLHETVEDSGRSDADTESKTTNKLFILGALFLSVFLGALIPSGVISSSTSEFVLMTSVHSPVRYIFFSFLTALGTFFLWCGLFYYLAKPKHKKIATIAVWVLSFTGAVNYLLFGKSGSILSSDLQFDTGLHIEASSKVLNLMIILLVSLLVVFVITKMRRIIVFLAPLLLIAAIGMSGYNIYKIQNEMPDIRRVIESAPSEIPTVTLSKDEKNVVVIMLDRAISSYIPYMFQEKPEVAEQFSGFTWYPNTLSYGMRTVIAAPALFGGYDYTPWAINERSDVTLVQKHNESLLTMPVLFSQEGYDVTVFDPPFAGYSTIPDLSIFDPYPEIEAYNTESGLFRDSNETDKDVMSTWKRNFFLYSVMKSSPLFFQPAVYTDGTYFSPEISGLGMQSVNDDPAHAIVSSAYMNYFSDSYLALKALPDMTKAENSGKGRFFMIQNGTAHNVMPLQEPEYEPVYEFNNTEYDATHTDRFILDGKVMDMSGRTRYKMTHYQCNMAAMIQLGNWLDHLREIGVYDNTRIIIVSDHGWPLDNFSDMLFLDGANANAEYNPEDAMAYNPVLLVKDFGQSGKFKTDYTFMTNADTPYLAMNGLIDDPVSPFTSRPLFRPEAKNEPMYVMYTDRWDLNADSGNIFTDTIWYSLNGPDIFDKKNWKQEEK